ncbi:MAG: hypothetical protein ACLT5P_04790 [Flavonifractor plautii]
MNRTSTALPSASYRANVRKVTLLALLVLLAAVCYMVVAVNFGSQQLMLYSMKIRTPAGSHAHHRLCHRRRLHRVSIHHQQYHRHPRLQV